jgi:hypothetical protein
MFMQARLAEEAQSLQYELLDPDDPSTIRRQPAAALQEDANPVVILGFNEASQVCVAA